MNTYATPAEKYARETTSPRIWSGKIIHRRVGKRFLMTLTDHGTHHIANLWEPSDGNHTRCWMLNGVLMGAVECRDGFPVTERRVRRARQRKAVARILKHALKDFEGRVIFYGKDLT